MYQKSFNLTNERPEYPFRNPWIPCFCLHCLWYCCLCLRHDICQIFYRRYSKFRNSPEKSHNLQHFKPWLLNFSISINRPRTSSQRPFGWSAVWPTQQCVRALDSEESKQIYHKKHSFWWTWPWINWFQSGLGPKVLEALPVSTCSLKHCHRRNVTSITPFHFYGYPNFSNFYHMITSITW